jgi:hypothetical protein
MRHRSAKVPACKTRAAPFSPFLLGVYLIYNLPSRAIDSCTHRVATSRSTSDRASWRCPSLMVVSPKPKGMRMSGRKALTGGKSVAFRRHERQSTRSSSRSSGCVRSPIGRCGPAGQCACAFRSRASSRHDAVQTLRGFLQTRIPFSSLQGSSGSIRFALATG